MTNWTTIRIRKRTKAQAESDKDESETWDEYLRRCNTETETKTDREFCDLEDLTLNEDKLHGRIDDLETEIKMKIEQETRR
ncbi:hypothetical protein OSG_eHPD7_00210 [environmental Halophage eHP-D7]|uniref:Uncharacterized protein n=1 Tax=uncultured virus TaxID=340016 RepID=D5L2Q3_9VIRU|nr:hypothetical protein [uncultured virus]AFH23114.1 hypothetical protein OSG_eHPD7_00210 [environmental Halophage eHP-D7]